jgi:hypothetical protein
MRTAAVRAMVLGSLVAGPACAFLTDLDGLSDTSENSRADATAPDGGPLSSNDDAGTLADGATVLDGGCPPPPNDPTLVAWYPFEEATGFAIRDCSGHGRDGKLGPTGVMKRVAGRQGNAIDLDGNGACFDLGPAAGLPVGASPFTVTGWIRPRRFGGPLEEAGTNPSPRWFIGHFGRSTGPGRGWGLGTDDVNELEFKIFDQNGSYDEATKLVATNSWMHVAGVWANGRLTLYLNGSEPSVLATALLPALDTDAHAWLGCRLATDPTYDGLIDDVRVYARALGVDEIALLAQ